MLAKQVQEIQDSEKFFQQMGEDQLNTLSLREDFQTFDTKFGKMLSFEHQKQPQDRVFDLIKDRKDRNFQEVEELERRVSILERKGPQKNIIKELKDQYLEERSIIVESGLTIWDIRRTYEDDILQGLEEENDDFSKFLLHFLDKKKSKNIFLWELMDEIILNLGKSLKPERAEQKAEDLNESDKQVEQKICLIGQLFKELETALDLGEQEVHF